MAKNMANLQQALKGKAVARPPVEPAHPVAYKAPSRTGKTNLTAYLSPDYKGSLRLIQAKTNRSIQSPISEALNDLFTKYDVPTVG